MSAPAYLRVEKGSVDPAGLAALIAVLRARRAPAADRPARPSAHWRRLEREPGFDDPRAWAASAS
ncbi:acyl-CoA carboxylase epsilon subunit [Amycolatopsis sp. NPDC049868]|uniref:acyl-CoA carboxylase epsilon subunit n=1 Tax=Amycolatopsis sp. NPDC049868 TaxID=3363934 RepID=UPI003799F0F7